MKLCKCGYLGHPTRACTCSEEDIRKYRSRLSGPLLDRIDLHVTFSPVPLRLFSAANDAESSLRIRERVQEARARQRDRYRSMTTPSINARASGRALAVALSPEAKAFLHDAADTLALSARAYNRVIKVACTIADLAVSEKIMSPHLAEALRYPSLGSFDRTSYHVEKVATPSLV